MNKIEIYRYKLPKREDGTYQNRARVQIGMRVHHIDFIFNEDGTIAEYEIAVITTPK